MIISPWRVFFSRTARPFSRMWSWMTGLSSFMLKKMISPRALRAICTVHSLSALSTLTPSRKTACGTTALTFASAQL